MEDQKEKNRSQYDTTLKDLFEKPPQRLLQILIGREAVVLLTMEFASTQKRLPDMVLLLNLFQMQLPWAGIFTAGGLPNEFSMLTP